MYLRLTSKNLKLPKLPKVRLTTQLVNKAIKHRTVYSDFEARIPWGNHNINGTTFRYPRQYQTSTALYLHDKYKKTTNTINNIYSILLGKPESKFSQTNMIKLLTAFALYPEEILAYPRKGRKKILVRDLDTKNIPEYAQEFIDKLAVTQYSGVIDNHHTLHIKLEPKFNHSLFTVSLHKKTMWDLHGNVYLITVPFVDEQSINNEKKLYVYIRERSAGPLALYDMVCLEDRCLKQTPMEEKITKLYNSTQFLKDLMQNKDTPEINWALNLKSNLSKEKIENWWSCCNVLTPYTHSNWAWDNKQELTQSIRNSYEGRNRIARYSIEDASNKRVTDLENFINLVRNKHGLKRPLKLFDQNVFNRKAIFVDGQYKIKATENFLNLEHAPGNKVECLRDHFSPILGYCWNPIRVYQCNGRFYI